MGLVSGMQPDEKGLMSAQPKTEAAAKIPAEINTKLRSLAHDLSNSVETIMQASYLLAQSNLDENSKKWADLSTRPAGIAPRLTGTSAIF